ncbi:hypothetical protein FQR65_LT13626 [Abscondita terminalis]|nr:hypothetical protein FQR65_LT13626 [Abscondita terminalis]
MYFSWVDYTVLVVLLCISVAVGIYYGFFGTKQNTIEQYMHGGKKMKPFPIAMSLTASHVSGITLLGLPAEIYLYGTQLMVCPLTVVLLMLSMAYIFLPVYYKLQLPSSFEYLKLRFGHPTRTLASCLYILSNIMHVPIIIYVPSLALNQVTGINVYVISPVICIICIFYTTIGGLKAVVLSDTIQFSFTVLSMVSVAIVGTCLSGGFSPIWDKAQSTDRIEFFNMSLDPTIRQTFWGIVFGMGVTYIGNLGINPSSIQRFLSLPTYDQAKKSVIIYGVGTIIAKLLSGFIGMLIFARYMDCDPLTAGFIKRTDQLLPYYALEALGHLNGLPGLFITNCRFTRLVQDMNCVGIYYGFFGTKQNTIEQYMHGGKKMKAFPIAMSLTASYTSGITLLGLPAEIYLYGTQLMLSPLTVVLLMLSMAYIFLPVYYKLQLPSTFEYLKLRFGHPTRNLASFLYILSNILHVPIIIYGPSLALNQVTGINVHVISLVICIFCIFYTTIGGLKAVVLSDTIQFSFTVLSMISVAIVGTYLSGGFSSIWDKSQSTDRIEFFNMSLDPTIRQTFWGVVFGMAVTYIGNLGINPSSIQRFLSLPTYDQGKKSVIIYGVGIIITKTLSGFIGMLIFARYMDCDPLTAGFIKRTDQLLPYYALEALGHLKGLPGLFIASVVCTALSTLSTCINTLSLTIYEDVLKSRLPKNLSQKRITIIMKSLVVISGLSCLLLVFVIENLGGVVQLGLSFHGLTLGPLVGITALGMLFPYANGKGAVSGGIFSLLLTGVIVGGAQIYTLNGKMKVKTKILSTRNCSAVSVTTLIPDAALEDPPSIFMVSHYFYSVIGMVLVIVIGLFASWITKKEDEPPVERDLLSPCVYRFLSEQKNDDPEVIVSNPEKNKCTDKLLKETIEN